MIIVKVWGGVGNQLFQFVFGQYLHYKYGFEVRYDDNSYVSNDSLRKSELLALDHQILFDNSCVFSKYRGVRNRLLRLLFQFNQRHHFIAEGGLIPDLYKENDLYFFQGYWQDYKYYQWLKEHVSDFHIASKGMPEILQPVISQIQGTDESVSVHVRRGDYFKPENIKKYGVCDAKYFGNAFQQIEQSINNPRFFIFSDDLDWVKNNLKLPQHSILIPNYDIEQFLYIELMSLCKHHIISNSSFSWWGAVLNASENGVVVAPSKWVMGNEKSIARHEWVKILV